MFLNTRGTFMVASAAFWWGRLAGLLFRVFHQVLPRDASLYLMLFADDGLLLTSGEHCHTLIFALFIYLEVMEVPLSWPKTRGGLETEWIGYTVDFKNWTLSISKRKVDWLNTWSNWAISEGRMLVEVGIDPQPGGSIVNHPDIALLRATCNSSPWPRPA